MLNSSPVSTVVSNSEATMSLPVERRSFPCKTIINWPAPTERPYPSVVVKAPFGGKALQTTKDCPIGTILEKFEGREIEYSELGSDDLPYALNFWRDGRWRWLIGNTPAYFANHGCAPNAKIDEHQQLVAIRPIKAGQEISFVYNRGGDEDVWDPAWTFECKCGAPKCMGVVDSYRSWEPLY